MKKIKIKRGETDVREGAWRREGENNFFYFFFSSFLSQIYEKRTFVGTEGKVDLRNESYAWTPKSWSFVKLHEVGNFPSCVIFSLKAI